MTRIFIQIHCCNFCPSSGKVLHSRNTAVVPFDRRIMGNWDNLARVNINIGIITNSRESHLFSSHSLTLYMISSGVFKTCTANFFVMLHCNTVTLLHCYTVTLLHCDITNCNTRRSVTRDDRRVPNRHLRPV